MRQQPGKLGASRVRSLGEAADFALGAQCNEVGERVYGRESSMPARHIAEQDKAIFGYAKRFHDAPMFVRRL